MQFKTNKIKLINYLHDNLNDTPAVGGSDISKGADELCYDTRIHTSIATMQGASLGIWRKYLKYLKDI